MTTTDEGMNRWNFIAFVENCLMTLGVQKLIYSIHKMLAASYLVCILGYLQYLLYLNFEEGH